MLPDYLGYTSITSVQDADILCIVYLHSIANSSDMREMIHIQVGHRGNQIGYKVSTVDVKFN